MKSEGITDTAPFLEPEDVAAAVTVILSQPLRVQVIIFGNNHHPHAVSDQRSGLLEI